MGLMTADQLETVYQAWWNTWNQLANSQYASVTGPDGKTWTQQDIGRIWGILKDLERQYQSKTGASAFKTIGRPRS